jgi:hypothetical protein
MNRRGASSAFEPSAWSDRRRLALPDALRRARPAGAVLDSGAALLPAALLLTLALVVIAGWRFEGLYGQDPYAYFDYGSGALRRSIVGGSAITGFYWPLGFPLPLALTSVVLGASTIAGQATSLISALAAVVFTYLLGLDLLQWGGLSRERARLAAALAASILAATGWVVEAAVMIMPDSLAVATATLSAWALVRWCRDDGASPVWLALASSALAWSAISRWGQLILAPVWLAFLIASSGGRVRLFRALPWAAVPAALIVGAQVWLALSVKPEPGLGRWPFFGDLSLVDGSGSGWSVAHLLARSFVNADGAQHYRLPNAVYYATAAFEPKNFTPLALPAVAAGALVAATRLRRAAVLLLGWPAVLLLLDAGLAEQNIRFVLPALPPLALLAGIGALAIGDLLGRTLQRLWPAALAAGLLLIAAAGMYDVHKLVQAAATDRQTARWAAKHVSPGSAVAAFEITATLNHGTTLHARDLSEVTAGALRALSRAAPVFLIVRVPDLYGEWYARAPGETYRALVTRPGLLPIGVKNGYTLYRMASP